MPIRHGRLYTTIDTNLDVRQSNPSLLNTQTNLSHISNQPQTPRDWSSDLQMLQNLDVLLSTRASENTLITLNSKFRYEGHLTPIDIRGGDASITQTHDVVAGYRVYKGIAFSSSAATTINVYASPDDTFTKLYPLFSVSNTTSFITGDIEVVKLIPWRIIRIEIVGTGVSGDTYDLLVVIGG